MLACLCFNRFGQAKCLRMNHWRKNHESIHMNPSNSVSAATQAVSRITASVSCAVQKSPSRSLELSAKRPVRARRRVAALLLIFAFGLLVAPGVQAQTDPTVQFIPSNWALIPDIDGVSGARLHHRQEIAAELGIGRSTGRSVAIRQVPGSAAEREIRRALKRQSETHGVTSVTPCNSAFTKRGRDNEKLSIGDCHCDNDGGVWGQCSHR